MGRPVIHDIDIKQFENLCFIHATMEEICAWFRCDMNSLQRWIEKTYGKSMTYGQIYEQKKGLGKISLRRKQLQTALAGNPALLIWLGKNLLKQSDKVEVTEGELEHVEPDHFKDEQTS